MKGEMGEVLLKRLEELQLEVEDPLDFDEIEAQIRLKCDSLDCDDQVKKIMDEYKKNVGADNLIVDLDDNLLI